MVVYFGHEVEKALKNTLKFAKISFLYPDTNTLSSILLKEKESVFRLLKTLSKICKSYYDYKKITPHKLRSTYGTTLYQETGDIYLVADVLGHRDVNTTKSIMLRWTTPDVVKRLLQYIYVKIKCYHFTELLVLQKQTIKQAEFFRL